MRIVIDMQGAQSTGSRNRGIGRYTFSLVKEIVKSRGEHEVIISLSGLFPDTIEPIRAAFYDLLPKENIRIWHAPGPVSHVSVNNTWRRKSAELLYESFLESLNPSIVLIASLFEGLEDDAVSSIGALIKTTPVATILYDLIPLINRTPYLDNPSVAKWYEDKLGHLRRADLLLSISESSRNECINHLGISAEKVVNISSAADSQFQKKKIKGGDQVAVRQRYGLEKSYVMYTGGIDHRKNIERLIQAYASLSEDLRQSHQLAVVCSIQTSDRNRLEALAKEYGLAKKDLILTGYVPEEDLINLYNLCTIFIFPSWHEGFGLPALEAMACGCPVIGSNTSSVPEVIGCEEALFDPFDVASIANKMQLVLTDNEFRVKLEQHGLNQARKFSWRRSAQLAIRAMEKVVTQRLGTLGSLPELIQKRPRLAYISPLPPERSGISDYSAELLPELSRYYEIEVVVAQGVVTTPWIKENCPIRTVEWFLKHSNQFDRVLYHFGNSPYHQHMFALLEKVPGVVVLHDFFLSGIVGYMDGQGVVPGMWNKSLYEGHGYEALHRSFLVGDKMEIVWKYPCNLEVLRNAQGVIVHSEQSRRLAKQWYGQTAAQDWALIPLLRTPESLNVPKRKQAREALGLSDDLFVVCSFGQLGPTKLNRRLVDAWLASPLAKNEQCVLIFVGENDGGEYGKNLLDLIACSGIKKRIKITGWANADVFHQYLSAADIGVQLRTLSRGETSAAVLDCMNYGLATVVNAHGSMIDLPDQAVWKLPDEFSDDQLVEALDELFLDEKLRIKLGRCAREIVKNQHAPHICAEQYFDAIENFYQSASASVRSLLEEISNLDTSLVESSELLALAEAIDRSIEQPLTQRQLFVDVSVLIQLDAKTGIQRVVRSILREWLSHPPEGYRIEPVYASMTQNGYRYARQFTLDFLGCPSTALNDEPISYRAGDIFLGLDFNPQGVITQRSFYQSLRSQGINVKFIVYDLLNVIMPEHFPPGTSDGFKRWLEVVAESDAALCISKSVADDLSAWLRKHTNKRVLPIHIDWFHLGADVKGELSTKRLSFHEEEMLGRLLNKKSFLMVGTLEPRKGHRQALDAFEILWAQGEKVNLVLVGKQGWKVETLVDKIRSHPEFGNQLFWLEDTSDEYLAKIYGASTALIAASYGEGFGLPLIESAHHKLPIIARDIPVFREVAGDYAFYFDSQEPSGLASSIVVWTKLYEEGSHPLSNKMPCLSWRDSANQLLEIVTASGD
ncbi:glycosyltransferase [Halomonas daqingensis]|uniref:Glycosyltransferase n=1 Tax=Billgrantia desiderata TaxID=52021 RepID=A0AAW4YQP9_9GAMM|nr:glycosyltransferase [Halomonas desiderata]MCE8014242.1 glycosyltransferase [Halomonas desiderata]MCE8050713.1 glycosyltransferase [Halomonas desiderata]